MTLDLKALARETAHNCWNHDPDDEVAIILAALKQVRAETIKDAQRLLEHREGHANEGYCCDCPGCAWYWASVINDLKEQP